MFSRILGVICLVLIISACSTLSERELSQVDAKKAATRQAELKEMGYRCDKVKVTGSNLPTRRCTTRQQREEESQAAKSYVNEIHNKQVATEN